MLPTVWYIKRFSCFISTVNQAILSQEKVFYYIENRPLPTLPLSYLSPLPTLPLPTLPLPTLPLPTSLLPYLDCQRLLSLRPDKGEGI